MANKRWRTWLGWGFGCAALLGVGFALDATLPLQPRFVLRGDRPEGIAAGVLTADGRIATARTYECDAGERITGFGPLKSWDTFSGAERGVFFRGLIGAHGIRGRDDLDERDYDFNDLVYSPDRRYAALVHRGGLALADLQSGREWPTVVASTFPEYDSPGYVATYRLLQREINSGPPGKDVRLKEAIEYISKSCGVKVTVDRQAIEELAGKNILAPLEQEVRTDYFIGRPRANVLLRHILSQGRDDLAYIIRDGYVEITSWKKISRRQFLAPVFSPRGTFLAFGEGGPEQDKLHIIECTTGTALATLATSQWGEIHNFGFAPDETMLWYLAGSWPDTNLTIWNLEQRKAVRTLENVQAVWDFAPDGENLLVETGNQKGELVNARTGLRRLAPSGRPFFSPDGRTSVSSNGESYSLWDMPSSKVRAEFKLDLGHSPLMISADSKVLVCGLEYRKPEFVAYSVQTGTRLWPPAKPEPPAQNEGGWAVQEIVDMGGLLSRADMSPRFTPDRRFLVESKDNRVNMLDPATGAVHASLLMDRDAKDPDILAFTPAGQSMLSQWTYAERKPWFGEEWLAKWLPLPKSNGCLIVSETATGKVRMRLEDRGMSLSKALFSDDGRTLLTSFTDGDAAVISCWDVPSRPSLWLVAGSPLGIGFVAVLIRWWRLRKKALAPRPTPVP